MVERYGKNITIELRKAKDIDLDDPNDPVTDFVDRLSKIEEHLREPVSWNLSHGRRRNAPNMRLAKEQRESQLEYVKTALKLLRERNFSEAKFYLDMNGKIIGFDVISDSQV